MPRLAWRKIVVKGLGAAFVATAQRLGWVVNGAMLVTTDRGNILDFTWDSPAFVQGEVRKAVWRWRWRKTA